MKNLLIALGIPVLVACNTSTDEPLKDYKCSEEQFKRVEVEAVFCIDKTNIHPYHCLKTAMMRNCSKKEDIK